MATATTVPPSSQTDVLPGDDAADPAYSSSTSDDNNSPGGGPMERADIAAPAANGNAVDPPISMPANVEDPPPDHPHPHPHPYPLHECVFNGTSSQLAALIRSKTVNIAQPDQHGNTALHLAAMLGKRAHMLMLLSHGAPVKVKNKLGWNPLGEAISYGDRVLISILLRNLKQQSREQLKQRKPDMIAALKKLGDYVLDLKWDFTSWLPLVSKLLPSDICKISKKGACVRLDTTLVDFNEMHWERGDITFLYRGDATSPDMSLFVMDNKLKVYQKVRTEESNSEFEEEVDILMSGDIISAQISTKPINFTKAQSGWIFKEDRQEMVGNYNATFYCINGISLETRKRREHLSQEDLQKNKALMENFAKGNMEQQNGEIPLCKESLPPPAPSGITWSEYLNSPAGEAPCLGRPLVCKESSKSFKATVAMSEDFPLSVEMLLNVLEIIAPQFKHFGKLRDFIDLKLPPGFPVKLDIPVLPTVSARVTFQDFAWANDTSEQLDESLFQIPPDYKEDPKRFADL